ncbi:hypothetical protein [Pimelobacter simplex]|uniref:hypothetical protein n=1 Tax=Nocardioides simplex TaxID=2045 RepID=UPI003AAAB3E8
MGSRLGVIVLDGSRADLYYDHWAAQTIGMDIALDGFEATVDRVRRMEPMGVDTPAEWTGATWIEGSLLIDLRRRLVAWAEESELNYLPRIVNHVVEHTWPGWTAVWSAEGVRGVLRLAGVDPTSLFAEPDWSPNVENPMAWLVPWGEYASAGDTTLSVHLGAGDTILWRSSAFLEGVAALGPAGFRAAAAEVRDRSAKGEAAEWDARVAGEPPVTGIHVDFDARTVRWWSLGDGDMQIVPFDLLWPGWSVETTGDAYEAHAAMIGKELRSWPADVDEVRRAFRRATDAGPRTNPLIHVVEMLEEQGERVTVHPDALLFQAASSFAGSATATAVLDRLAALPALPPARIVDRHGSIIEPRP